MAASFGGSLVAWCIGEQRRLDQFIDWFSIAFCAVVAFSLVVPAAAVWVLLFDKPRRF